MHDSLVPYANYKQPRILRRCRFALGFCVGVLALIIIVDPPVVSRAFAKEGVTVDRIVEELMAKDIVRIQRTLDITSFDDEPRMQPFILDLWNDRRDKYPNLPWDIVMTPQIRIHLANILVPVAQHGGDGVRDKDIRDYAWGMTESPDDEVVLEAFSAIGRLDKREDVAGIEQYLADDQHEGYVGFFGAVWALARMCNEDASQLLDALERQDIDQERQEIIAGARSQWKERKEHSRLCE